MTKEFLICEKNYDHELLINPEVRFGDLHQNFIIEYLVYEARKDLLKAYSFVSRSDEVNKSNLQTMNLTGKCFECSEYIKIINRQTTQLDCYYFLISPAYEENSMLYEGGRHHRANIVKYDNKYYLIDVTFSQFFYSFRNCIERLGIMNTGGCHPGVFMLMTEKGRILANKLIRDGYLN